MSGDRIDAREALRLGLLNRIFPDATFREETLRVAHQLASGPAETLAHIKRAVYVGAAGTLAESLAYEEQAQKRVELHCPGTKFSDWQATGVMHYLPRQLATNTIVIINNKVQTALPNF